MTHHDQTFLNTHTHTYAHIQRTHSRKLVANPGWQPGFPTSFQLSSPSGLRLLIGLDHADRYDVIATVLYCAQVIATNVNPLCTAGFDLAT